MDKPSARRMTLRQLLTHSQKCAQDLAEQLQSTMLSRLSDARDLSRPVRKRSHYPTMLAMANSLNKVQQANQETKSLFDYLVEQLEEIREHAKRERLNRR